MTKKHIVIICPLSLNDPLIKGLILDYTQEALKQDPRYIVHFFTDEQEAYRLNKKEKQETKVALKQQGIWWYPMKYRNGGALLLFWKVFSGVVRAMQLLKIKIFYRPKLILGYISMAGGFAYLFSKLLSIKLGIFCFEPHSEYMRDFGIWTEKSVRYKILKKLETLQVRRSIYLTAPTRYTVEFIHEIGTKAKIFPLPISIDFDSLHFLPNKREEIRQALGFTDEHVLLYLGKFNGVYYSEDEVAEFLRDYLDKVNNSKILVITPDDVDVVKKAFDKVGIDDKERHIQGKIPYEKLSAYISAADIGLIAVPPLPAQKFRTPVKTANYLACGMPVITNYGVSDEAEWMQSKNIGVGLHDFKLDEQAVQNIHNLLSEEKATLRKRCREEAIGLRGKANSVKVLKQIFEEV